MMSVFSLCSEVQDLERSSSCQGRFYVGAGGAQAPKCWPGPPNILVPTAKIRIVKIYAIFVQWRNQHSYQLVHKQ